MGRKIVALFGWAVLLPATACISLMDASVALGSITIATVPIGNPGNPADSTTGLGSVGYNYNIGKYDVTVGQYTAFLNAVAQTDAYGLYNPSMVFATTGGPGIIKGGSSGSYVYSVAAGRDSYPVTDVTFWDATRFANWLANGQPTGAEGPGTTETGSYTLTSTGIADNTITRNAGATWAVASENEWYKAGYSNPTGGYSNYPTQSNTISTSQANYSNAGGNTTPVGSYSYPSYYGTYDQGGDVFQWNESILPFGSFRGLLGGSFSSDANDLQSDANTFANPADYFNDFGFRVSQVPEPASAGVLAFGVAGLLMRRRCVKR